MKLRQEDDSICALTGDQDAFCRGPGNSNVRTLHDGPYREMLPQGVYARCGLTGSGEVTCDVGQCRDQTTPSPCQDLSDWQGRVGTGPGGKFTHLTGSSSFFLCGLREGGYFVCWGDGYQHVLASLEPKGARFRELSVGEDHVCGITLAGEILCWGANQVGQSAPPAVGSADAGSNDAG